MEMPQVNFGRGAGGEGQETVYVHEDTQRKSGRSRWDLATVWGRENLFVASSSSHLARMISVPDVVRCSPRDAGTNEPSLFLILGGCIGDTLADSKSDWIGLIDRLGREQTKTSSLLRSFSHQMKIRGGSRKKRRGQEGHLWKEEGKGNGGE